MIENPAELGFRKASWALLGDASRDVFAEDDVGTHRCRDCERSVAEVDELGHATDCATRKRLERREPYGKRRRAVGEWPGLRGALQRDDDLRRNLIREILELYRREHKWRRRRLRALPSEAYGSRLRQLVEELDSQAARLETLRSELDAWAPVVHEDADHPGRRRRS